MAERVTSEAIEGLIANMELRGDFGDVDLLRRLRDRLLQLEAQNQAYRHALQNGVSIKLIAKKHWFRKDQL